MLQEQETLHPSGPKNIARQQHIGNQAVLDRLYVQLKLYIYRSHVLHTATGVALVHFSLWGWYWI